MEIAMIRPQNNTAFVPYERVERDIDSMLICDASDPIDPSRRNYYQRLQPEEGEHPIARMIRLRLENDAAYRALWKRILQLSEKLGRSLDGELLETWLAIEEALHEHSARLSEEHYNHGVEDGQTAFTLSMLSGTNKNGSEFPTISQQLHLVAKVVDRIARHMTDLTLL